MLMLVLPIGSAGCFGRFQLLRNVYTFNTDITPDPWMRWFVFLILNLVPIYGLAGTIDLLLANSIEFWTGKNPVEPTPGTRRSSIGPDGSVVSLFFPEAGRMQVSVSSPDGAVRGFSVTREADSLVARDLRGDLLARVADVDGRPAIVEAGARLAGARLAAAP